MAINETMAKAKENFQKTLVHLQDGYKKLQVGRASAVLVEGLMVEMYGTLQPMKAVANISVPDSKTLSIQPWDKSAIVHIEKAIANSGLGLNPVNNGLAVIINMPPLTEERRAEVVKKAKTLAEEARIGIRTERQEAQNAFKRMKADKEITEDEFFGAEAELQKHADDFNRQIEDTAKAKAADIMTI